MMPTTLKYQATLSSKLPLPKFVTFNPEKLLFTISDKEYNLTPVQYNILVTATSTENSQIQATYKWTLVFQEMPKNI